MTDQDLPEDESIEGVKEEFASAPNPKQVLVTDEELKSLQREAMDYKDKYLRLLADSDNARKRLQKEKQEISRYAAETILIEFLKPIDNMENALKFAQAMSEEVKNWATGFQMILSQFKDVLNLHGVKAIDAKGSAFDPHQHEAVEMVETNEFPSGIVIEECAKGYQMGDRTIRPARVKVSKAAAKESEQQE